MQLFLFIFIKITKISNLKNIILCGLGHKTLEACGEKPSRHNIEKKRKENGSWRRSQSVVWFESILKTRFRDPRDKMTLKQ